MTGVEVATNVKVTNGTKTTNGSTNGSGNNGTNVTTNGSSNGHNNGSENRLTNGNKQAIFKENGNGAVVIPNSVLNLPKEFENNDEILDPYCDPKNPQKISFHDITSAAFLIKDGVERTPCPVSGLKIIIQFETYLTHLSWIYSAFNFVGFLWHGFIFEKGFPAIYWKVNIYLYTVVKAFISHLYGFRKRDLTKYCIDASKNFAST